MKYIYYPGCSLEGTALEYDASTRAAMGALGAELTELNDWTCCGASAADAISYLLSMVLAARNLALAEGMDMDADIMIPCSACYLNLRKVEDHVQQDGTLMGKINEALEEEGLAYNGGVKVRHLLDVMVNDIDPEAIAPLVKKNLAGLGVAVYYGCQALRPYATYDDHEQPRSLEPLIKALGADVHPWEMGAKCCGAALMTTKKDVAMELTGALLKAAQGADCIVTVCPMCEMNLEAFQEPVSKARGEDLGIPVLYLPQLIGLALGLSKKELKLNLNLALADSFKQRLSI
ncbi:MAG: CoB--CoM heterodisulfide reductase iron-sulfur subunit B family protein [Desulfobacteraceae bacterium]|nr:CoB--CoM heterodisulfide reductase iron-sulfur subunit B family protein [Desulfobacteraceae bacterium]